MFYDKYQAMCFAMGKSPNGVAKEIGVSSGAVSEWKKGRTPRFETIQKIADYFHVSAFDLMPEGSQMNITYEGQTVSFQIPAKGNVSGIVDDSSVRMIPLFESVSAGFGALAVNSIVDYVPAVIISDCEALQTIAIRVHGDSMYPKIEDGDIVIVHKQDSVDNGTLAVVLVDNDEGFVKRVEYGADWIHLISNNPIYPAIKFQGEDVLRVRVVGRVTKIIKEV